MNLLKNNLSASDSNKKDFSRKPPNGFGEIVSILQREGHLTQKRIEYAGRVQSKVHTSKSMLAVIKELEYITDEQIRKTIRENLADVRIGDLLVELGLISHSHLQAGLSLQAEEKPKRKLGEVLVAHHFIDEQKLIEVLSLQLGFPFIEPEFAEIDKRLFSSASIKSYISHNFVPIRTKDQKIIVAFADPLDQRDLDEANKIFGDKVLPAISTKKSIHKAIDRLQPQARTPIIADIKESVVNSSVRLTIE